MAEYKTIKGFKTQSLSSDPTLVKGQVWYNTTTAALKFTGLGTGTWASGGTLNTPYMYSGTAFGTQNAAVFAGGIPGDVTTTQTYNGTAWAASPATLNVGRHYFSCAGVGTNTAGLTFGGEIAAPPYDTTSSESFNGSTWTATNGLTTSRHSICGVGTSTAAIAMTGGNGTTGNSTTNVESWNGTCWTATTAAPHSKKYAMGGGTQTSAFLAGGTQYPWTEVGDLGTAAASNAGTGTTTLALSVGNGSPNNGQTEEWTVALAAKTVTVS